VLKSSTLLLESEVFPLFIFLTVSCDNTVLHLLVRAHSSTSNPLLLPILVIPFCLVRRYREFDKRSIGPPVLIDLLILLEDNICSLLEFDPLTVLRNSPFLFLIFLLLGDLSEYYSVPLDIGFWKKMFLSLTLPMFPPFLSSMFFSLRINRTDIYW